MNKLWYNEKGWSFKIYYGSEKVLGCKNVIFMKLMLIKELGFTLDLTFLSDGPETEKWGGVCKSGSKQSPIDINTR